MSKIKERVATLASIITSKGTLKVGVFEDYNEALQFKRQEEDKTKWDRILLEDINFFPKKRQRKEKS